MISSGLIQINANTIIQHASAVYFFSALVSFLSAWVINSLLRRSRILRDDDWARPLAWAFYIIAIRHSVGFLFTILGTSLPAYAASSGYIIVPLTSSLSNYFLFRVGFALTEKSKVVVAGILDRFRITPVTARYAALLLFFVVALVDFIGGSKIGGPAGSSWWWTRIPDAFISAFILGFVGVALYRNISVRRDALMAALALVSAMVYAALHVPYAFHPWIAQAGWADWIVGPGKIDAMDLIVFSIAILPKLGLFFSGYTLMLMTAGPIRIKGLLEEVTNGMGEFLDHHGVVRSLQEQIHASRVELYMKLPGTKRDRVARYRYPAVGVPVEKGKPEVFPFDMSADYGYVMRTGEDLLFRLTNYSDQVPLGYRHPLASPSSAIAVPILFHKGVIGCLKAELDEGRFTEADTQNVQSFAALLSPIVQNYREVDALNGISHRLTRLQIEASEYKIPAAIEDVAKINHDILAPLATGISIEAGFCRYKASTAKDEYYCAMIERQLDRHYPETQSKSSDESLVLLFKSLRITSRELPSTDDQDSEQLYGDQFFGKLLLATHKTANDLNSPTLATNFFHRRVVSNLITDALLSFIRGSLNEVTRRLAVRLSGLSEMDDDANGEATKEAKIAAWFEIVDKTAREADLLWAVTTQPDEEALLGEEAELIRKLENQGRWDRKDVYEEYASVQRLHLCALKPAQGEASHVIKILLRETKQTIWLGVGNPAFDKELDYLSPWAGFILRFGEIADTGLQQILSRQKQEALERDAADFQSLATAAVTTSTVIHQIVNLVRDLISPITALEVAIKLGRLKGNENHKEMILAMGGTADQIEDLTKLFTGVIKPDVRRPCSLNEAIQQAKYMLRDALTRYNIKIDSAVPPAQLVDVPFYIATSTLANLLNNAKDAIRDGKVKDGVIRIFTEETEKMILCHVVDNGPGVPPRIIPDLFKSGGKSAKEHGHGLGLYLSARSIRESGGDIKLTQQGPAPPTTFTLYFPKPREV
ncbi:MAG: ATP-binding protein [Pyrinomonadaceae bacterium]